MPKKGSTIPQLGWRGGIAYAFWYDPAIRQRRGCSLRTSDPDEATTRFAEFLVQGRDVYTAPKLPGLKVAAALDSYLVEHVSKKNADPGRADDAARNLKAHFGLAEVKAIDIPMCRHYVERRMSGEITGSGRPGAAATARRELVVLIAAINHAVKWKRLTLAEVPFIELPPDSEASDRWLTREEMTKLNIEITRRLGVVYGALFQNPGRPDLIANLHHAGRLRDFIEIAYYTASRRKAVETLTWFQVSLERGVINLAKPGERKTKKRRPVVRIDPALLPTLQRLWDERTGSHVLGSAGSVYRAFVRACKAIGIEGVSPHTLRHSRATHLLQDGESVWDVAKLLGDTVATVERVYGHHSPEYQRFLAERKREEER